MVKDRKKDSMFTPVSIPTSLFDNIKEMIKDTGFPSVSSFATYILREVFVIVKGKEKKILTDKEKKSIEKKLKDLGYLK